MLPSDVQLRRQCISGRQVDLSFGPWSASTVWKHRGKGATVRLMDGMNRIATMVRGGLALGGLLGIVAGASANPFGGILFRGLQPVDTFPGESCSQCHRGGKANPSTATLEVLVNGSAVSAYAYMPGETVALTINFTEPEARRLGFLVMARSGDPVLPDSGVRCGPAGSMMPGESEAGDSVKVRNGTFIRRKPEPCGDQLDDIWWATQSRPTLGPSATWEVLWALPESNVGPITVSVVVNGGNGDGETSGDNISSRVLTIEPAVAQPPPQITGGGDVLAGLASPGGAPQGAPGAIASVTGSNFLRPGTAPNSMLDDTGRLPTLDRGTCVEIGDLHRARLLSVDSDTATFQIPSDIGLGSSTVRVVRGCGTADASASASMAFDIVATRPLLFQFSEDEAGLTALGQNLALVAPAGHVEGRRTRPAVAGDIVNLFGTGLGPVEPPYEDGEFASALRPLRNAAGLRVMIGEMELEASSLLYAGSAPFFTGLHQLILEIPESVPAGSHNLSVHVDSVVSLAGPKLEVAAGESLLPTTACSVDLVLNPLEGCLANFSGTTGVLEVDTDGKACVLGSTDVFAMWECDAASLDLTRYGAAIEKQDDGTWKVTMLPEEEEIQECTEDLTVNPGESCQVEINYAGSEIDVVITVDDEGVICATTSLGKFCDTSLLALLPIVGAEIEDNKDGTWTISKLPAPPSEP